jgi:cell wall-associated NlpC family hydrolase
MSARRTGAIAGGGCLALMVGMAVVAGSYGTPTDPGPDLDTEQVPAEYREWVLAAGEQCAAVSPPLIAAQIHTESNWNPQARSAVGALGLSQFMPNTWATWGVDANGNGRADPYEPEDAIATQGRYDCWLADDVAAVPGDRTQNMLAAYNAGPQAVKDHGGLPPYPETQRYVQRILDLTAHYSALGDPGDNGSPARRTVAHAEKWLGTPYSWGGGGINGPGYGIAQGAGTKGFDCSSLLQYAVYHASSKAIRLPRTTQAQALEGQQVSKAEMRPGDAIFMSLNSGSLDHVGIYAGNGIMIHAPRTGTVVRYEELSGYYASKRWEIRRFQ